MLLSEVFKKSQNQRLPFLDGVSAKLTHDVITQYAGLKTETVLTFCLSLKSHYHSSNENRARCDL